MVQKKGQPHLAAQDAATVDPSKLTALTPEVVSNSIQNLYNIFMHLIHVESCITSTDANAIHHN